MSIFSEILERKRHAQIIYENSKVCAFLDAFPAREGHTLIIPKVNVDYFRDLDEDTYLELFRVAKLITPALEQSTDCDRICLYLTGYTVPHCHLHVIPTTKEGGKPIEGTVRAADDELDKIQSRIISNLKKLSVV